MDITEETEKLTSNPLLRNAVLLIGLLVLFLSQSILTWKRTAERDAVGHVKSVEFKIYELEKQVADSEDADEKKELHEDIQEIKETKLAKVRMEAAAESVDAQNGIWLWSMARLLGTAILSLGLLIIASVGSNHEKVGALIALGVIISRL
jgi:hypothetical protein